MADPFSGTFSVQFGGGATPTPPVPNMRVSASRTIVIGNGQNPSLNASVLSDPLRWKTKNPGSRLDHSLDLTLPLAEIDDSLASVGISAAPSGAAELVIDSVQAVGGVITAYLSGGWPGRNYAVQIDSLTASGETFEHTIGLLVSPALATFPLAPAQSLGFGDVLTWVAAPSSSVLVPSLDFTTPENAGVYFFGGQPTGPFVPFDVPPPPLSVLVPSLDFTTPENAGVYFFGGQPTGSFVPFDGPPPAHSVPVPSLDFTVAANSGVLFFGGQPTGNFVPL